MYGGLLNEIENDEVISKTFGLWLSTMTVISLLSDVDIPCY